MKIKSYNINKFEVSFESGTCIATKMKNQEDEPMKHYEFNSIESFLQAISKGVSVVYCSTSWSSACRSQYQAIVEVGGLIERQATVYQADMVRFPELGEYLAIQSVPTTVIFEDGEEVRRLIGRQPLDRLRVAIGTVIPVIPVDGRDQNERLSM